MAGEPGKPGGEGGAPQDPGAGEGAQPQDPATGEGREDPNVHKLERDVANRDKCIRELEERLAEATGGQKTAEERIGEIEKKHADMEAERDAAKADATLSAAGCIDCELARPALDAPRTQDDFCDRSIPASSYACSPRMRGPSLTAMRSDALRPVLPAYAGTINRPAYEGCDLQVSPCANGGIHGFRSR